MGGRSQQIKGQERSCLIRDLGCIPFQKAYAIQKQYLEKVYQGHPDTLLICEHPPVVTLGRMTHKENLLISEHEAAQEGIQIIPVDRGGDITLHAPGQLISYPIFNLTHFGKDLHRFIRQLEQGIIDLLADFDIVAKRFPNHTGVWVKKQKIASIGIGVKKWISFHGLSININTHLNLFSIMRPCGLDVQMTSMKKIKGESIDMGQVKSKLVDCFKRNFNYA